MSTIASPREASVNGRRVPLISTPTSSSRPSLEIPRPSDSSPHHSSTTNTAPPQPRRNRAALRSYYNLKSPPPTTTDVPDDSSSSSSLHDYTNASSDIPSSILDSPSFDAPSHIQNILETQSLVELLKTYNGVLTDIRALDAEKKALVYDNYSKLIAATETIRRMRDNMDPLNPMARTLDMAVVGIWERAEGLKRELRERIPESQRRELEGGREEMEKAEQRRRARGVVKSVLESPGKVRDLVREGRDEEAKVIWDRSLRLLERWRERGVGGDDVQACIDDGEAALRGEPRRESES